VSFPVVSGTLRAVPIGRESTANSRAGRRRANRQSGLASASQRGRGTLKAQHRPGAGRARAARLPIKPGRASRAAAGWPAGASLSGAYRYQPSYTVPETPHCSRHCPGRRRRAARCRPALGTQASRRAATGRPLAGAFPGGPKRRLVSHATHHEAWNRDGGRAVPDRPGQPRNSRNSPRSWDGPRATRRTTRCGTRWR
jgi:hypothetical protein